MPKCLYSVREVNEVALEGRLYMALQDTAEANEINLTRDQVSKFVESLKETLDGFFGEVGFVSLPDPQPIQVVNDNDGKEEAEQKEG